MREVQHSMQEIPNIGYLCDENAKRDAIHVAIAPVVAGCRIIPGEHIRLRDGRAYGEEDIEGDDEPVGIADPFLRVPYIEKGQRFYLFLYPGTVTSLRHVWTHPAFATPIPKQEQP